MVDDATSGTAEIVLDLPGFAVLAAAEYGGELEVLVETTATVADCPWCGRLPVVWPPCQCPWPA